MFVVFFSSPKVYVAFSTVVYITTGKRENKVHTIFTRVINLGRLQCQIIHMAPSIPVSKSNLFLGILAFSKHARLVSITFKYMKNKEGIIGLHFFIQLSVVETLTARLF